MKITNYPVLIGSQSIALYGWKLEGKHDWDLVCTEEQNKALCEKEHQYRYGYQFRYGYGWRSSINLKDHRLDCTKIEGAKKQVFDLCNGSLKKECLIKEFDEIGTVIVPPLEILYAIKKSHIHRILYHHPSTLENSKTWRVQVIQYNWMREKLGYKRMDSIIYHKDGDLRTNDKKSSESDLDYAVRSIFADEFTNVTERVGDTKISMNKTEKEFFVDGVNRYIEHDELHRKVAQICRQTDHLLFMDFMSDTKSVEMNQDLFLKADRNIQIQTIKEEIIVLLLERKLIPTMVRNRDFGICYNGLDMERRTDNMREIIAHFVTNLCGQGHHWLRRWCIDHYKFFDDIITYPHKDIDQIAVEISRVQDLTEKLATIGGVTLSDFVLKGNKLRTYKTAYNDITVRSTDLNSIDKYTLDTFTYSNTRTFAEGDSHVMLKCIVIRNAENIENCTLKYIFDAAPLMTLVMRRMTSPKTKYVYKAGNVLYDSFSNIGIVHKNGKPISLFRISNIIEEDEMAIHIEEMDVEDPKVSISSKAYKKHSFNYYYESEPMLTDSGDDLCPGQTNTVNISRSYLSTYGTMSWTITQLIEPLVRNHLNVIKDEKKLKKGAHIGNMHVYTDDYDAFDSY